MAADRWLGPYRSVLVGGTIIALGHFTLALRALPFFYSPVGLSVVTKLSPARIVGLMMGVWFLSNAVGNKLAGWAAGFFGTLPRPTLFGAVAGVMLVSALFLVFLVGPIKRLMGGIR